MTARRIVWALIALLALAALAVLIPGSPAYLPTLIRRHAHFHEGHGTGYWIEALNSPDAEVRRHAIFALGMLGTDAEDAVPALSAIMVDDPDGKLRGEAALALSKMTPASRAAVPALARALEDKDPLVRMNAVNALFRLRTEARPAAPALIQALNDRNNQITLAPFTTSIQEMAALALGRASAGTPEAVPALMEALKAALTDGLRYALIRALGDVGPEARPAASQILALRRHEHSDMRHAVEEAVRKIGLESPAVE